MSLQNVNLERQIVETVVDKASWMTKKTKILESVKPSPDSQERLDQMFALIEKKMVSLSTDTSIAEQSIQ